MIDVSGLRKVFRVPEKDAGLWGSVRSLFARRTREVVAVDGVDLSVSSGERIGLLGPNGAGKTTTLKMLTGLLHPTSGTCRVAGYRPQDRDPDFLRAITLVMGQKQQLLWDLPATETFLLNRALFDLDRAEWTRTVDELVTMLELAPFLNRPVRTLSLGERMRCELAAALLHRPRVLFLDEPTIGLDVEVQVAVRRFVRGWNEVHGATVVLTSHDMNDVSALADRIVLIDQGVVRFDGSILALQQRFGAGRRLSVRAEADLARALDGLGFAAPDGGSSARIVAPSEVNGVLQEVLRRLPTAEVTVTDPPLEEVLTRAFGESRKARPEVSP
ncbi:MAG: ATP-binding cassette domain-containing protein [Myxococcota bacterium]